jgi:hypothetical protein
MVPGGEGISPGAKWPGREADHSPEASAPFKNGGAVPLLPQYIFMAQGQLLGLPFPPYIVCSVSCFVRSQFYTRTETQLVPLMPASNGLCKWVVNSVEACWLARLVLPIMVPGHSSSAMLWTFISLRRPAP